MREGCTAVGPDKADDGAVAMLSKSTEESKVRGGIEKLFVDVHTSNFGKKANSSTLLSFSSLRVNTVEDKSLLGSTSAS